MVHYRWNNVTDNILCEQDDTGQLLATYTQEPGLYGELISQRRGGQTSYYHFDGQGSTRQLTDQNQNVTDEHTYSAFGETVASTGTTVNPFRYNGAIGYYAITETGEMLFSERVYSPLSGRWLSADSPFYSSPYLFSPFRIAAADHALEIEARRIWGLVQRSAAMFPNLTEADGKEKKDIPANCPKDILDKKCQCTEFLIQSTQALVCKILKVTVGKNKKYIMAEIQLCTVRVECCITGSDTNTIRFLGANTTVAYEQKRNINLPPNVTPTEENKESLVREWFSPLPCWRSNAGNKGDKPCLNKVAPHCPEEFKKPGT